ncbi:MAG: 23S rRNA (adenine(2030)-N(6))-methyltransferase RlmJ [Telmatospirillum sp.]|nr:23S rRNA (adenine(2030)-N(6))-methyltransferase RlmJ [Telmatospirillum sp.]
MNYRHAFHAGNFADLAKHAALGLLVRHLAEKPKGFCVLDTHAGLGEYDLLADAASRTGEWQGGIGRVFGAGEPPASLAPYLDAVNALNSDGVLRWYPGSPRLIKSLLRPQDRLIACELHPQDAATLQRTFARERGVEIRAQDGYQALASLWPPRERRGLALIDPPFERTDEFAALEEALRGAHRRFATGTLAAWYPIKGRAPVDAFLAAVGDGRIRRVSVAEFMRQPPDDPKRFNGSGLVIVNAPWQFDEKLRTAWEWCAAALEIAGGIRIETLVGE